MFFRTLIALEQQRDGSDCETQADLVLLVKGQRLANEQQEVDGPHSADDTPSKHALADGRIVGAVLVGAVLVGAGLVDA